MNVLAHGHRAGDLLLHVSGVKINWQAEQVTCDVSDRALDLMTLNAVRNRDRTAVKTAARRPGTPAPEQPSVRSAWDCESGAGKLPSHPLHGGLFNVLPVPFAEAVTIARTRYTSSVKQAFFVAVFGRPVTAADCVRLLGANPLAAIPNAAQQAELKTTYGLMIAWGQEGQAAGFSGAGGAQSAGTAPTGLLRDDAGWEFNSADPPWGYVVEWAPGSTLFSADFSTSPLVS